MCLSHALTLARRARSASTLVLRCGARVWGTRFAPGVHPGARPRVDLRTQPPAYTAPRVRSQGHARCCPSAPGLAMSAHRCGARVRGAWFERDARGAHEALSACSGCLGCALEFWPSASRLAMSAHLGARIAPRCGARNRGTRFALGVHLVHGLGHNLVRPL